MGLTTHEVVQVLDDLNLLDLDGEGPWTSDPHNEDAYEIDWTAANRDVDDELAVSTTAHAWDEVGEELRSRAGQGVRTPTPDVLDAEAWYLPIHFYGPAWGIYIRERAVLEVAAAILTRVDAARRHDRNVIGGVTRAALSALYLHEAFHHKVESFATRLEMVERLPRYVPYSDAVYRKLLGTPDLLEEGLACAEMLRRGDESAYRRWVPLDVRDASREMLRDWIGTLPPGYARGSEFATDVAYLRARNHLSSQVHEAQQYPSRPGGHEWNLAPGIYKGLFDCRTAAYVLVPIGQKPIIPWFNRPPLALSISSRALMKIVEKAGYSLAPGAGKGSHIKMIATGRPPIIIPANRESLSKSVLRNTAVALGLRSVRELGAG